MNIVLLLLVVVLFPGEMLTAGHLFGDPDLWRHLADARILWTTHHFIRVEPYAFTEVGRPWTNPEWLAEIPFWMGYKFFGLMGIFIVTALAFCANLLFVYGRAYWRSLHAGAAFWVSGIAFMLMTVNAGSPTIVLAYLLMSVEMAILEAADRGWIRPLWLLPLLFCLWVNIHASWLIGMSLLVLYMLCGFFDLKVGVFEQIGFPKEVRNRLLLALLGCLAALTINPYGLSLLWNPFNVLLSHGIQPVNVEAWQPLHLNWFAGKGVVLAILIMVIAACIRSRKRKVYEIVFVVLAFYAAFDHSRFTFLAAIVAIPMLAVDIEWSFLTQSDAKTIPVINLLIVVASIFLISYASPPRGKFDGVLAAAFPMRSIAEIQPSWRTFNEDRLGGMMDFQQKPTFIDSRFYAFSPLGVLSDYGDIMSLQDSFKLLDAYRIDHALLPRGAALSYLLEHTAGWSIIDREGSGDAAYYLFERTARTPAHAETPHMRTGRASSPASAPSPAARTSPGGEIK